MRIAQHIILHFLMQQILVEEFGIFCSVKIYEVYIEASFQTCSMVHNLDTYENFYAKLRLLSHIAAFVRN